MATGSNDAAKLRCFRSFSVNMEWLRIVAPREIYYLLLRELDRFTEKFVADLIVFAPFSFRACVAQGFLLVVVAVKPGCAGGMGWLVCGRGRDILSLN